MKLTIVFLFIAPIFSLKCSNCKHFIIGKPNIFGKCNLFPKTNYVEYLPGDKKRKYRKEDMYYYCSTAREYSSMCGVEGKLYEPK
jgi:hypothetical protein